MNKSFHTIGRQQETLLWMWTSNDYRSPWALRPIAAQLWANVTSAVYSFIIRSKVDQLWGSWRKLQNELLKDLKYGSAARPRFPLEGFSWAISVIVLMKHQSKDEVVSPSSLGSAIRIIFPAKVPLFRRNSATFSSNYERKKHRNGGCDNCVPLSSHCPFPCALSDVRCRRRWA